MVLVSLCRAWVIQPISSMGEFYSVAAMLILSEMYFNLMLGNFAFSMKTNYLCPENRWLVLGVVTSTYFSIVFQY